MGNSPHQCPGSSSVEYLLVSTPNVLVANRVRTQLEAAGIHTESTHLGLEVWCRQLDWQLVIESISIMLTPAERRDTRVAKIGGGLDAASVHHAVFRAKSVERLLHEVHEGWLEDVLAEDRLEVHFQPLVQYPPGRLHGYECLLRGVEPSGALISAGRLFDAAEALERMPQLDERCRSAALRACAQFADDDLRFFINFIPSAVTDAEQFMASIMRDMGFGLSPQQIVFEVVETDRIHDHRQLGSILRRLRKAGFKVALDDVGSGYSSLLSLCRLRPDYIKLDGELVRRAAFSTLETKMVADLAETARQNGIITVAEGIETEQQLKMVMDCGIRLTQGYIHARPQPRLLQGEGLECIIDRIAEVARA